MRGRKTVLLLALVLLTAFSVVAQKKKTVTFMCTEADLPKEFVDKFNAANPDINLVRQEEDWTKWTADAMAGSAADLIRMGTGTDVAYYSKRGLLYDMTAMLKKSKIVRYDDIDKAGNSAYQFDGTNFGKGAWYGLTKDYNNIGAITYNKEMFKAAGLAPLSETKPITYYDELLDLGKKLTKKDASGKVTTWGYDFSSSWVQFLVSDMATASKLSFYADAKQTKLNEDPKMRELWKYFTKFPMADIASNVRNPSSDWVGAAFQSDRVAMAQLGYWFGAQLQSNPGYNEKYGWAPTPIMKAGSPRVTNNLGGATGIVMYKKTKVPKEAFRVFEWYMGGDYGLERAKTGWGIPPLVSLGKYLPEDNAYNKSRKAIAFDDAKYFKDYQANAWTNYEPFQISYSKHIDDLVKGSINADQFVDAMYADVNEALKTGMEELGE